MTTSAGPFSAPKREEFIARLLGPRLTDTATAWRDVYRLLLWTDVTTGLAHCYESDKSQPGRPWYARSLAFHAWLAEEFAVAPELLADEVDLMFKAAIKTVVEDEASERTKLATRAESQRARFDPRMPRPGDDPELRELIEPLLPTDPALRISDSHIRRVLKNVHLHIAAENKRKNLLGRGFEDVLKALVSRLPHPPPAFGTQTLLEDIPGFAPQRTGDKQEKVDFWVGDGAQKRIMVTAKWSVRADREKQMRGDFATYDRAATMREPFEFVWVTNEFDPARLLANATGVEGNRYVFDSVVHVCVDALRVVHSPALGKLTSSQRGLLELLDSGRIVGLGTWFAGLPQSSDCTEPNRSTLF